MTTRRASMEARFDGKSPVRAAVLAVVVEAPGHGWDVAKRASRRLGASWGLDGKHIYSYLQRLERDGYVRRERESFKGSSEESRDVFYATEKGERARAEWLASPLVLGIVRTDIQVRLAFSNEEDIGDLLRAFEERRIDILEEIASNKLYETPQVSYVGVIISLHCLSVDKRLKAEMEWIDEASCALEAWRDKRSRR